MSQLRQSIHTPKNFFLIFSNTLTVDPTKRMSAQGILDFLDRKCVPETSRHIVRVDEMSLFQDVTVGQLRQKFESKNIAYAQQLTIKICNIFLYKMHMHRHIHRIYKHK